MIFTRLILFVDLAFSSLSKKKLQVFTISLLVKVTAKFSMSLFCVYASCLLMALVISFFLLLLDLFHYQSDLKINLGLKASFSFTVQEQIAIVSLDYLQK